MCVYNEFMFKHFTIPLYFALMKLIFYIQDDVHFQRHYMNKAASLTLIEAHMTPLLLMVRTSQS